MRWRDEVSDPVSTHVLIEGLSIASLAAVSYVSTNLDNLVVLSAYGAKPGTRPFFVKLIFVFVCVTVLLISLALARAADTLPTVDLRYLGLIPITLGAWQLVQLMMDRGKDESGEPDKTLGAAGFATYFAFALVLYQSPENLTPWGFPTSRKCDSMQHVVDSRSGQHVSNRDCAPRSEYFAVAGGGGADG